MAGADTVNDRLYQQCAKENFVIQPTIEALGADLIILRHSGGAAHLLAENVKCRDQRRMGREHPTQALHIFSKGETRENSRPKVAIVGDILHSRVAMSNIYGLTKLGAKVMV